jgi:hypothetical protein
MRGEPSDDREEGLELPRWCDLSCRYAGFPSDDALDGSGSCRTFAALHCSHLDEIVTKNAPCEARRRSSR